MKNKDYEAFVTDCAFMPITDDAYSVIGLAGEVGEVCEHIKKAQFRKDARFTEEMLFKELGDVLHYATRLVLNHGWTLERVMQGNMVKLEERKRERKGI